MMRVICPAQVRGIRKRRSAAMAVAALAWHETHDPARLMLLGSAPAQRAFRSRAGAIDSVLVLADDGALDDSACTRIRNIAASELRKHGVVLAEDRRTGGVHPLDAELSTLASISARGG